MNDVVADEDFTLSRENLTEIRLPNEENFFEDPRPDTPTLSEGAPCMQDCKPPVEITMRAVILDVTPESGEDSGLTVE
jgi:cytochrome c